MDKTLKQENIAMLCTYLIFVVNAVNGMRVKKIQKNEKSTVLGSVYIAAVMYYFTLSV